MLSTNSYVRIALKRTGAAKSRSVLICARKGAEAEAEADADAEADAGQVGKRCGLTSF